MHVVFIVQLFHAIAQTLLSSSINTKSKSRLLNSTIVRRCLLLLNSTFSININIKRRCLILLHGLHSVVDVDVNSNQLNVNRNQLHSVVNSNCNQLHSVIDIIKAKRDIIKVTSGGSSHLPAVEALGDKKHG